MTLFNLLFIVPLFAGEVLISTGEVFDKEGKEKMFTYERFQDVQGKKVLSRAVYKDLKGDPLTVETMETIDGKLVKYDMDQKQIKQHAWIEVADSKVTLNLKKFRKRNYPQTVKMPKNFIVGLQIVSFVQDHWDSFVKGGEQEIHLGVWHRQEAIKFDLTKENSDDKTLVVKMNPASMFIRAVVNPIYFTFDKSSKALISYRGRVTPKVSQGRSFADLDGMVKYKAVEGAKTKAAEKKPEVKKPAKKK